MFVWVVVLVKLNFMSTVMVIRCIVMVAVIIVTVPIVWIIIIIAMVVVSPVLIIIVVVLRAILVAMTVVAMVVCPLLVSVVVVVPVILVVVVVVPVIVVVIVQVVHEHVVAVVVWSVEVVVVFATREGIKVFVHVEIRWDISKGALISVDDGGESIHEEICDSIVSHIEGAFYLFNFVDCLVEDFSLKAHVMVNNLIDQSGGASVEGGS